MCVCSCELWNLVKIIKMEKQYWDLARFLIEKCNLEHLVQVFTGEYLLLPIIAQHYISNPAAGLFLRQY
jgi:hypothetical protein